MSKSKETIEKDLDFRQKTTAEIAQMSQSEQKQYWTAFKAYFMAKKAKTQSEVRKRQTEAEKAARRDLKKKRAHYFCVIGGIIEQQLRLRGKALNYEINGEKEKKFAEYVKNQEENGGLMSKALCATDAPSVQDEPQSEAKNE